MTLVSTLTAGFMGKIRVFRPALEAANPLVTTLVVVAVIGSAISAYYYLRLIVVMFFRERTSQWIEPKMSLSLKFVLVISVIGVFYLGLFSGGLIEKFAQRPSPVIAAEK